MEKGNPFNEIPVISWTILGRFVALVSVNQPSIYYSNFLRVRPAYIRVCSFSERKKVMSDAKRSVFIPPPPSTHTHTHTHTHTSLFKKYKKLVLIHLLNNKNVHYYKCFISSAVFHSSYVFGHPL